MKKVIAKPSAVCMSGRSVTVCLALLVGLMPAVNGVSARAATVSADAAKSDTTNPHVWKPRTTSVSVFKNGLGFFMREGEVTLRDGWCVAKQVPPAAFGTLAIYSHAQDEIVDIVGSGRGEIVEFDGHDSPNDRATKLARLESSKNLKVALTYTKSGKDRSAAGKLVSIGTDFAVLANDDKNFAVPINEITKLQILELPLRIHVTSDKAKQPEKTTIGMAHLQKGITWIPEYSLKIVDQDTAILTLRGTLVNEAEDLVHCDVNFVVGVPHFVHTDFMAPIAVGQMIRSIGASVAPIQVTNQIMNRAAIFDNGRMSSQFGQGPSLVDVAVGGSPGNVGNVLGNLPQMQGQAGSDYTVYTKKDLTVRRGEKAIVTLFVKTIKYSHVYRWNTAARMQHFLVLHNSTSSAWTTGPCLGLDGNRPLTEDLLRYTPKGGNGELEVTTAINVAHEITESEIGRKLKAHSPSHDFFLDLVTLEGKVNVRNFEKKPVEIVITTRVQGKPLDTQDGGATAIDTSKLKLTERRGTVTWTLTLKANESKTLSYRYERYVPSR